MKKYIDKLNKNLMVDDISELDDEYYPDSENEKKWDEQMEKDKEYLALKLESISEAENIAQEKLKTGQYWREFEPISNKQQPEKVIDLLASLNKLIKNDSLFLASIASNASYLNTYFETFEHVFSSLSTEFQSSTMQKILKKLNEQFSFFTNEEGVFQNKLTAYSHSSVSTDVFGLSLLNKFQDIFLLNSKYEKIFTEVRQNSTPENTKLLIQTTLHNLPIEISEKWLNKLWEKEEHNLNYLEVKSLAINNNQALSYLLKNFSGWDNKKYLKIYFENGYLGQTNIDNLFSNIGKIQIQASEDVIVSLLDKRKDISNLAKIDILKTFFTDLSKNNKVFNFMTSHLLSGSKNKEEFEAAPFYLSKSIKNNYKFILEEGQSLLDSNIIEKKDLELLRETILSFKISQLPEKILEKNIWLNEFLSNEEKSIVLKSVFTQILDNLDKKPLFFEMFKLWEDEFDKEKLLAENFLILKNHSESPQKVFSLYCDLIEIDKNSQRRKELFEIMYTQIFKLNELIVKETANKSSQEANNSTESIFKEIIKNGKGWDFLFDYFKEVKITNDMCNPYYHRNKVKVINDYLDYIKNDLPEGKFNLKNNNPLEKWIECLSSYYSQNEYRSLKSEYTKIDLIPYILKLANEVFDKKLSKYKNEENKSLTQQVNTLAVIMGEKQFEEVSHKVQSETSFNILKVFSHKKHEPPEAVEILPNILVIKNNEMIFENNNALILNKEGSSEFILKSQKEISQIRSFLLNVTEKEKPYNLEIKIKIENLIMDYSMFVSLVDDAKDMIAPEDMHFLQNNLGLYLMESLKVYDKAVTRYEVMNKANESGNFKKLFSGKSETDMEIFKEKIDNECLRQINLLERQLELVKNNIMEKFGDDSLKDMKIKTKFYSTKFHDAAIPNEPEVPSLVKIR